MPKAQIAIHILADGQVVFGDLPPQLAAVADVLQGSRQPALQSAIVTDSPPGDAAEQPAAAARCGDDLPT